MILDRAVIGLSTAILLAISNFYAISAIENHRKKNNAKRLLYLSFLIFSILVIVSSF